MKTLVSKFDKRNIPSLPRVLFQGRIVVVQSRQEAKRAVDFLLTHGIIGIDTETRPTFQKGRGMNPVALLQASTEEICFLFRLCQTEMMDEVVRLLSPSPVLIVGLSLHDDFMQLHRRKMFRENKYVELQKLAKEFGIQDMSLLKLYANLLNGKISKKQQLSNWEAEELTEDQKRYAATDAWACIQLYKEFNRLDTEGYMLDIIPE